MLLHRYWIAVALVLSLHTLLMAWMLGHRVTPLATPSEQIMQAQLETPSAVVVEPSPLPPLSSPKPQQQPTPVVIPPPVPRIQRPALQSLPPPTEATESAIKAPAPTSLPEQPSPPTPLQEEKVTPPRIDASYQGNAAPPYPRVSRTLGEAGIVILRIFVNTDGTVGQVQVEKSSGYARLDHAAEETVHHWKLLPARLGNQPIAMWYVLPINFNLTVEN